MSRNFIQIRGPFQRGEVVIQFTRPIKRLGIEVDNSDTAHDFTIINEEDKTTRVFSIGESGIMEFTDAFIETLSFNQDEPESTMINYILT